MPRTPDPNNPRMYVLRAPELAGSMGAVPKQVLPPSAFGSLSRTPTPGGQKGRLRAGMSLSNLGASAGAAPAGRSRHEPNNGDASHVPGVISSVSTVPALGIPGQPVVSECFTKIPSPGDKSIEEGSKDATGLMPLPLGARFGVGEVRSSDSGA